MFKKLRQKHQERKSRRYSLHNQPSAYDEAVLAWVAPETISHRRGPIWKTTISLLLLTLIGWSLYTQAWTFTAVLIVLPLTYYMVHLEHPKYVEIKISHIGIKVGARKYPYSRIQAFWIIYEPHFVKTLNIRVKGEFVSDITVQLDGQHPAPVREILLAKIPELEGQIEKVSDTLLRILKI